MPIYKYNSINNSGEKKEGTYKGNTKNEVLFMLRENGYYPIKVEEVIEGKDVKTISIFSKVKIKDIAIFCRQFHAMLNAGVPIISCLDILSQQTENKKLKVIVNQVYNDVQKGSVFSEAMKKHEDIFPELLLNMIEAGEVSGNLDIIMDRMANHFEKENKLNNKVRGAMVYPIMLSAVAVLVVVFLLTFVMPSFIGMFEGSGVELPLPTRILLAISDGLQTYWYIVVVSIMGIAYGIKKYKETENGKLLFDSLKLKIPVVKGTTQKVITSRFTRTLSTLLGSGISLIQALETVSRVVGNKVVANGIMKSQEEVRKGISLAEPIKDIGVFPPMVTSMIKIGEDSGSLEEILNKTADFYDEEVEVAIQKMTTMLEPIMIVVMAVIIGSIVIAMMLPMFDMVNTIQM